MALITTSAFISSNPTTMSNVVQTRDTTFNAFQGASFNINFPVYNYNGNAFDLTDWSPSGWMNQSYDNRGVDNPISLIVSVQGTPTQGILNWQISNINSLALIPDRYYFNIDITQGNIEYRVLRGILNVIPGVSPVITITTTQTITGQALIIS